MSQEETAAAAGGRGDDAVDVIVVGAGQAGLAIAWYLARLGLRFQVLEASAELGQSWRSRWDSLTLFTPAQYDALPGMPFPAPADTYPTKEPVADYLQAYADAFRLPVRLNARVTSLSRSGDGFEVRTADETFSARRVVVATGPFQVPFIPPAAGGLDSAVTQIHSADYRNPQALPDGPVLVVGGGNSGLQIAEELSASRRVDVVRGDKPADAAAAAGGPGPVLVAHPARSHAGAGRVAARPPGAGPGRVRHRDQPAPAEAGRRHVPAAAGRRRRAHGRASPTAARWTSG